MVVLALGLSPVPAALSVWLIALGVVGHTQGVDLEGAEAPKTGPFSRAAVSTIWSLGMLCLSLLLILRTQGL